MTTTEHGKVPGNEMMTVTVKQLDGQTFNIECSRDASVLGLKTLIMESRNITIDRQRLIYRAQELVDSNKFLTEYGVENGSVLHIVIRPVGASSAPQPQPQQDVEMGNPPAYWNGVGEQGGDGGAQGAGGRGVAALGGNTFATYRLCRFVKIFAIIDTIFLFLYGISASNVYFSLTFFVLALFALAGVYGAMKLRKHLLILYMTCLVLEIGIRCYYIYIDNTTIDVILLVIMILIDLFVFRCTIQLYKAINTLTPQQIQTLMALNNRCF